MKIHVLGVGLKLGDCAGCIAKVDLSGEWLLAEV